MNGLVSTTLTLEQKSVFKLERNKDLTFIVIIIDIDWYEKNYRDHFLGHIAQPYKYIYNLMYKPDSKKVGTLYKLWIKKECNNLQIS